MKTINKTHLNLIYENSFVFQIILLCVFLFIMVSNLFGQQIASFEFEKKELLKPTIILDNSIAMSPIPNNTGISTLFDNFELSLQNEKDALSGTITTGFRVPIKTVQSKPFVYYTQDLRGMISKDKDSRIAILIDLAGKTTVIEFPFGRKVDQAKWFRSFPRKLKAKKNLFYSATFTILVERRNVNSVTLVSIDSFDLTIRTNAKAK